MSNLVKVWRKTAILAFIGIIVATLSSCDYFGEFDFVIENRTGKEVTVSYVEQLRNYEDIFPTYRHGDDYEYIRFADADSTVYIKSDNSCLWRVDVGLVDRDFPDNNDVPEAYNVVPLWERITAIVVGTDTIPSHMYAKYKWQRNSNKYTLVLE
ncbi:MAG: hypothetical protein IKX93_00760 [Bacteroidaceae bacterium]|nr:hypothetical protein [Bacteroidaceae bacterium]MBR5763139.1 hypothetical protein [Bacteroidaceae bacterium]